MAEYRIDQETNLLCQILRKYSGPIVVREVKVVKGGKFTLILHEGLYKSEEIASIEKPEDGQTISIGKVIDRDRDLAYRLVYAETDVNGEVDAGSERPNCIVVWDPLISPNISPLS